MFPVEQIMKVSDPNLSTPVSAPGTAGAARANATNRAASSGAATSGAATSGAANASPNDDVHLSELVRNLRSLASDSPERAAKIEHLTRAYASGNYKIDAEATAAAIVQDAISKDGAPTQDPSKR